ncbi:toll/interleukin-1 receptor domain-containing protein [Persephonella sp. KM09-Lau-8]|uniref:toll/interleukin-1 receptor domain-containing protein n=1 Tax=Persephonella sp. KM09-Lau-8 TaxID=1158345 RepID=UPI000496E960|nr:toll/interleukin-1 receptor domain-containing protein [Persephonella sp. KM09-Lau-8]
MSEEIQIFISHKKEDEKKAIKLSDYIEENFGFSTYVDVLDDKIHEYENVTERIVSQLRNSTHLLVVFSEHTKKSMWVPFELGVAYEREEGIGVYIWPDNPYMLPDYDLPEYLEEFPKMKDTYGLNKYLNLIKEKPNKQKLLLEAKESLGFTKRAAEINYAQEFINELKKRLGQ